jgi:hypothetical protein
MKMKKGSMSKLSSGGSHSNLALLKSKFGSCLGLSSTDAELQQQKESSDKKSKKVGKKTAGSGRRPSVELNQKPLTQNKRDRFLNAGEIL